MTLRREVVNLIRLNLLDDANQIGGVSKVAVMQLQLDVGFVRILIEMIDPISIEQGGAALDPVNDVALAEQQLGKISPVLSRYPGNQRCLRQVAPIISSVPPV